MELQELVSLVTKAVVQRLTSQSAFPCVEVVGQRDESVIAAVRRCLGEKTDLLFWGEDGEGKTPTRHVLPFLSCRDMADLASGRAAGPVSAAVLDHLLAGRVVEVLTYEYRDFARSAPEALYRLYERYQKDLASYGLVECKPCPEASLRLNQRLVTAATVAKAKETGASVLILADKSIVTPAAADAAKIMGISMEKADKSLRGGGA